MALILVADDNDQVRNLLREILQTAGHQVFEARDGHDALSMIPSIRPTLAIVDMVMPNQDGTEVIQTLRREHKEIKVIAISGGLSDEELNGSDLAKRCGATRAIQKPFDIRLLLNTVDQALNS